MTNEDAIKYLKQLYPYGGHCWLDKQRTEAIGMAIKALQEEPVSEDLAKAIDTYLATYFGSEKEKQEWPFLKKMAIYFANWQKEQFEKNRLAACDKQTEEEAEIERDFVIGIIEKEHRQPTFDDAIKYGAQWQKEKMIANTADATIGLPYENKDGGYTHLIDVSRPLPVGDNKIAIIFKEE